MGQQGEVNTGFARLLGRSSPFPTQLDNPIWPLDQKGFRVGNRFCTVENPCPAHFHCFCTFQSKCGENKQKFPSASGQKNADRSAHNKRSTERGSFCFLPQHPQFVSILVLLSSSSAHSRDRLGRKPKKRVCGSGGSPPVCRLLLLRSTCAANPFCCCWICLTTLAISAHRSDTQIPERKWPRELLYSFCFWRQSRTVLARTVPVRSATLSSPR